MKEYIRKIFYDILSIINKITKKDNRIVIYGGNRLRDNNEAIFRYLLENTDYEIVCITDDHMNYDLRSDVFFFKDTIWNAMYYLWTSRVVIDSSLHRVKMRPTNEQLFFQLWHGSPLKMLKPGNSIIKECDYFTYLCYAADCFKEYMKFQFGATELQMCLNGNPRCDDLFHPIRTSKFNEKTLKSVVWLPTYRSGLKIDYKGNEIPVINSENIEFLNNVLREKDIMLYIKPHPLSAVNIKEELLIDHLSNIMLISDKDLIEENIPLYAFLGTMDALLTDYSSVYFDYLLIDKPIGFVIDDVQTYRETVGYVVENPLDYMPGEKIYNLEQLCVFFNNLANGIDLYKKERADINNLVNYYKDDKNSYRVVEVIKDYMK